MNLDLSDLQGNVVPGFKKDHQAFVFVHFRDDDAARTWLAVLKGEIATGVEVDGFNAAFKSMRARRTADAEGSYEAQQPSVNATWLNLAISFSGLGLLPGASRLARFPLAFRSNAVPMVVQPAERLRGAHALLIVAADRQSDLEAELGRQRARMRASGVDELASLRGDTLPGDQRGHEHFGFKDAISQPAIVGTSSGEGPPVAAGEFILGLPDETGRPSASDLPEWTRNGSFLAFLQLQQHVETFWSTMRREARLIGVKPEDLAAWTIGRKRDAQGTPLNKVPSRYSHIGRGYAHWLPAVESSRHRLIRRGVPYGPPWKEGEPDGAERGLLFVAYQADIVRQFEHVWKQWLNGPDFPGHGAGRDALVGQLSTAAVRPALVPRSGQDGGALALKLPAFVTPRYGGYFFAPSISALSVLLDGGRQNTRPRTSDQRRVI